MAIAQVVIGAGYGDEGKGRTVDYLANRTPSKKLIVRFNGGAQAGHNVVLPDGTSHIHSHFSSGTITGHDTFLSNFFICNPLLFMKEYAEIRRLEIRTKPNVYVSPACPVTTPYEMFINQKLEQHRGKNRHGSVGVGINETVERHLYHPFNIAFWRNASKIDRYNALDQIRNVWMPIRLAKFGILLDKNNDIYDDGILNRWLIDLDSFLYLVKDVKPDWYERELIFEGAQGLKLDQDYGQMPFVTRSNTGLTNVLKLTRGLNLKLDTYYVTRSYLTRHGRGPLAHEYKDFIHLLKDNLAETNVTSEFQEHFRYAPLDLNTLFADINQDIMINSPPHFNFNLIVTCLDQWEKYLLWYNNGIKYFDTLEYFKGKLQGKFSYTRKGNLYFSSSNNSEFEKTEVNYG